MYSQHVTELNLAHSWGSKQDGRAGAGSIWEAATRLERKNLEIRLPRHKTVQRPTGQ